jgi:hypothetical protein
MDFDSESNLFFLFYLFEAMVKTGVGDFTHELKPWKDIVEMGMSGTPEKRIEQHPRSEIHPWTAHPVHYYFSVVAGIRPTVPGFSQVEIAPNPGGLKEIKASCPTIHGMIELDLEFRGDKWPSGMIRLPEGMKGTFIWNGRKQELDTGKNGI